MNLNNNLKIKSTNNNVIGILDYSEAGHFDDLADRIILTKQLERDHPKRVDDYIWVKKRGPDYFDMDLIGGDGEVGDMCGNGIICALKSLRDQDAKLRRITLKTRAGEKTVAYRNGEYSATIGRVGFKSDKFYTGKQDGGSGEIYLKIDKGGIKAYLVDAGEPHIIIIKNEIRRDFGDLKNLFVRYSRKSNIFPSGINFNLVNVTGRRRVEVETFERGCKRKTASCGTGSVSAVALLQNLGKISPGKTKVRTAGGEFFVNRSFGEFILIAK